MKRLQIRYDVSDGTDLPIQNNRWWCYSGHQYLLRIINRNMILSHMLALLMLKPEYYMPTWSIPWLLMPWLLVSPGHQHPLYYPCRIVFCEGGFQLLYHLSVEKWCKSFWGFYDIRDKYWNIAHLPHPSGWITINSQFVNMTTPFHYPSHHLFALALLSVSHPYLDLIKSNVTKSTYSRNPL